MTGSVVGVVTSLRTGAPLPGVTVSVPSPNGGIISVTTDSNGAYALRGLVPGASYTVRFAAAGYVPRFADAPQIPNSAGDYPSNGVVQVDQAMAQANATLKGHVYGRDLLPASGVELVADLRPQGFDLVATARTDAQGAYTLTGLPGAPTGLPVAVVAQPWDANGDGVADYGAQSYAGSTYPQVSSLLDVDLRLAAEDLLLIASNVETGTIAANTAIQLTFNQVLDQGLTSVTLDDTTADPTAQKPVAIVATFDATGTILTVAPAPTGTLLAANHAYSLKVDAVAAVNGAPLTVSRSVTAIVPTSVPPAVAGLVVVTPEAADYDTASFTLTWNWDPSANATGYQVWVRDTSRNPDYLLVQEVGSSPAPSATVTLPATFDYYSDSKQTPFAFGVGVDFAVVAVNAAGALSPTSVTPVHLTDTVAPVVQTAFQSGNSDNSAGTSPKTITLSVTFGEYMDNLVVPTITLPASVTAGPFVWNADGMSGKFSITIPASTNGNGSYTVSGAKDSSGNAMKSYAGTLGPVQLVSNGTFESGVLTPWTTSTTGNAVAPSVSTAAAATGSYSAMLGGGASYTYGDSKITSPTIALPSGYSSIVASVSYRHTSGYSGDHTSCAVQNLTTGGSTTIFSTYSSTTGFTTATANVTAYAGQNVQIVCNTYQYGYYSTTSYAYVDDISIVATP
ncbi:carboxypeptidase regulatory-like domain-containing protein [Anaeromyxobacter oryzisoli]|uniref:carboxypeptidase regulatory-like domain-containing protein n=1 Tax=Anaeromyxobacter oryzisoli TaxID=2925408 RepID=UPI001F566C99|nr:carboxypeptidase regulatory-like domain-containing protein [Anaeromyxobacter sp. SG63]